MRPRTVLLLSLLLLVAGVVYLLLRGGEMPEESTPSPTPARRTAPPAPRPAAAPDPGVGSASAQAEGQGRELLRATWGSGPGQVGRRGGRESNPEGPMGLAVDSLGNLLVLDQVNGRVKRFGPRGEVLSSLGLNSKTGQDLLVDPLGRTLVLDRLGKNPGIEVHEPGGGPPRTVPITGGLIKEGGGITGLFADGDGVYVEDQHDDLVRVADNEGNAVAASKTIPGRPTRDGKLYLKAGIIDRASGRLYVQAHRKDGALAWETPVTLTLPVLHILLLGSDLQGNAYLGAEVGVEDPATQNLTDLATVVVRLDSAGQVTGTLTLPPTTTDPAETFRPLIVGTDGTIYHMVVGSKGIVVRVYRFQ